MFPGDSQVPIADRNVDEVVAEGATLAAGFLVDRPNDYPVLDVTPFSLGIRNA